jgi:NAD(P)-dependent dehydrogenase (short-subunit alcohol dehydrogenase family)
MERLKNKVAIITGAASGMGKAMAMLFSEQGAKLVLSDTNERDLVALIDLLRSRNNAAEAVVCDVSDPSSADAMVGKALSAFGKLDIVVNNAGIMDDFLPAGDLSDEVWNRVLSVNLNGPFYLSRKAIPIMVERGSGSIVTISSIGGIRGSRAGAAYTTSKHALIGLCQNIAFMYSGKGIRSNVIAPGGVKTNIGLTMHPHPFGYERCISGASNAPRMGESEEIAMLALFLASDESSLVNGAVVTADAGWTAY